MQSAAQVRMQRGQGLGMLLFIVACIIAGWAILHSVQSQPVESAHPGYNEALEAAQADGNNVLLIFTASWCGPCKSMKKNVYYSPQVRNISQRFEWVTIDVDMKSNQDLSRKFGVRGIPAHVIVNSKGSKVASRSGSCSASHFAGWLKEHRP